MTIALALIAVFLVVGARCLVFAEDHCEALEKHYRWSATVPSGLHSIDVIVRERRLKWSRHYGRRRIAFRIASRVVTFAAVLTLIAVGVFAILV